MKNVESVTRAETAWVQKLGDCWIKGGRIWQGRLSGRRADYGALLYEYVGD